MDNNNSLNDNRPVDNHKKRKALQTQAQSQSQALREQEVKGWKQRWAFPHSIIEGTGLQWY